MRPSQMRLVSGFSGSFFADADEGRKSSRTISQARGPRMPNVAMAARPGGVRQAASVGAAEANPVASQTEDDASRDGLARGDELGFPTTAPRRIESPRASCQGSTATRHQARVAI